MTAVIHNNLSDMQPHKEQTFCAGDYFMVEGALCQLCQVKTHRFTLIACSSGNRYDEGMKVARYLHITLDEVRSMTLNAVVAPVASVEINYKL